MDFPSEIGYSERKKSHPGWYTINNSSIIIKFYLLYVYVQNWPFLVLYRKCALNADLFPCLQYTNCVPQATFES